jgi:hypothetical protein
LVQQKCILAWGGWYGVDTRIDMGGSEGGGVVDCLDWRSRTSLMSCWTRDAVFCCSVIICHCKSWDSGSVWHSME